MIETFAILPCTQHPLDVTLPRDDNTRQTLFQKNNRNVFAKDTR